MRRDMAKVIVERPRYGGGKAGKGRPPRELEDAPSTEGMRRPHVLDRSDKSFSDHLAPLRRYLMKQVGRPWNKVYSEICAQAKAGSTVQRHLRDHLGDFVSLKVVLDEERRPRVVHEGWSEFSVRLFYVDPRNGLLRLNKPRRRRA